MTLSIYTLCYDHFPNFALPLLLLPSPFFLLSSYSLFLLYLYCFISYLPSCLLLFCSLSYIINYLPQIDLLNYDTVVHAPTQTEILNTIKYLCPYKYKGLDSFIPKRTLLDCKYKWVENQIRISPQI